MIPVPDFRKELYARYVSTFKDSEADASGGDREGYLSWCNGKYGPLFDGMPRDTRILELGCGPGDMLEFLRRRGFEAVEGIDLSAEQVRIACDRGLNARVEDVFESLNVAGQRYGVILAVDFLEHFSKDELMRLMPAIRDALEPGGHLIVQTPNGQGLFSQQVIYGDLTHLTIFTPGSLSQLLRLFDFDEFLFVETGPVPKGFRGRLRVFAWRVIRRCLNLVRMIEAGKTQNVWTENMICVCTRRGAERLEGAQ
jgi:2-polyprenyl-3-methyl-5-hydroxy-6-metoxy-1,4-benzoquinol methylase